jgi:CRISPR-associated protein Csx17
MNEIVLAGCTATPLANYLKSLGVLRLLASKYPDTRACWRGDTFVLLTSLDVGAVMNFFLEDYEPTPVMAPWNGGSGFYEKDNKTALLAIKDSTDARFASYRRCIAVAEEALAPFCRDESPKGDDKARLLSAVRGSMPDSALEWFDASIVLAGDAPQYPPLLGTGGNDGRLDFTNNFMQHLIEALPTSGHAASRMARGWLEMALHSTAAPCLVKKAIGQYSPGQAGGPNASTGFDADAAINPWDYVLMLEGALMFAAAASRRNADDPSSVLSYPFTVRSVGAGAGSLGEGDAANARGEVWMPMWRRPASHVELRALLGEGRVAMGRKPARDALDFVRAVQRMGSYRGVSSFQRFGLLMRSGKAYLATPIARVEIGDAPRANLTDELDRHAWLERFRQFARGDNTAKRFLMLRRQLEDRIFELPGREPTAAEVQSVLVLLGAIQHALSASAKAKQGVAPVPRLTERWVTAADDGSPEFRIARALAGLHGVGDVPLPLRAQIFPVLRGAAGWVTPDAEENVRTYAGRKGLLVSVLGAWLQQRLALVQRLDMKDKPMTSAAGATLDDVAAFLQSDRMDARIATLLPGLSLCDIPPDTDRSAGEGALPSAFALMKLALTTDRDLRSLDRLREDESMPTPAGLLPALLAGNHDNRAVKIAWRRLRASGLTPFAQAALPALADVDSQRAAAALLIPLRWSATASIARALLDEPERDMAADINSTTL